MFRKKKKKQNPKIIFTFGLVAGLAAIAIIIPLALLVIPKTTPKTNNNKLGININDLNPELIPTPTPVKKQETQKAGALTGLVQNNKDAKILVEIFGDFECPFGLKYTNTYKKMLSEYGNNINFEYKHFPLAFHANAQKAAEAFECAKEQNKEWKMHDKIYEASANKNMSVSKWKSIAKELNLNPNQFNSCLDNNKYLNKVKQDQTEGVKRGVRGTPTTFINGQKFSGAVPYEVIKETIEKYL